MDQERAGGATSSRSRRVWGSGAALLALAVATAPLWLALRPQPLVVVFVLDALRADHLSQYGYARPTSPGLDALAEVATLFENAYAPASYTTASTASLFTGLAPTRHGAGRQGARLADDLVTFAEVLRARGHAARGVSFNPVVSHATGFTQGFADFVEREAGSPFNLYPDVSQGLDRLRHWLDAHPGEPQLLYFQVMNTHGPYLVPRFANETLLGRPPRPEFQYYREPMGSILAGDVARRSQVTPAYVESAIERYDTAIRYTTDQLGAFLDELRERGLFDEALIVLTADHGDEFFEHGGFSHGYTLHEEVVRVPLLVKLPGQREGRRVSERVTLMDVLPTLAEAMGAAFPPDLDGRSLLPLLDAGSGATADTAAAPALQLSADFAPRLVARARIEGLYKLIAIEQSYDGAGGQLRLYDLASDPGERENLAAREPARVQAMLERLLRQAGQEDQRAAPPAAVPDDLDHERLRALGYVVPDASAPSH